MEDEHKSLEPQQDNETLRNTATLTEMMDDEIEETSSQDTPDETIKSDDDNPIENGESGDDTVEETTAEETIDRTQGGTIDAEETQTEELPEDEEPPLRDDKRDDIKKENVIEELCKYKSSLDCDKFCNILKFLVLILLSLSGIVLLVLVKFGVWNVKMNRSTIVLIYGLILLFIVATIILSFMLTTSNRRYGSAINRLDLLITRIGFMKNESKMLLDVHRELQLIARILELSNEKTINV